jgi:hypothetical protein
MDAQKAPKFNFLTPSKNDILNTLERLKAYGCTKSTKVQLEEMPHKQKYIFNQRYSITTNVWELKMQNQIFFEQCRMMYV